MRTGSTLNWLFADHLGSTSRSTDARGNNPATQLYKAWGETRYSSGTIPTTYLYTGQHRESSLGGPEGLYFYGARWLDPALGRFTSPDSIIPEQSQGVQAWDRYAYANNNAVKYNDPTGHMVDDGCRTEGCSDRDTSSSGNNANRGSNNEKTLKQKAATAFSYFSLLLDTTAAGLSDFGAIFVDVVGTEAIMAGCATGPEGCAGGLAFAADYDYGYSLVSPPGIAENVLGVFSFASTATADFLGGNTGPTEGGYKVGVDTLVSGRNMLLGFTPEANIDAVVSNSQMGYDLNRLLGNNPGGSIQLFNDGRLNVVGILTQLVTNWW
jgi:RHS repeat-associated protein